MKVSDIVEGGVYEGRGMCYIREVDFIFPETQTLHWFTTCTMPAQIPDGRVFHMPNRCSSIKYFARWARRKVLSCPACAVTPIVHPAVRFAAYRPTMAMSTVMGNRQDQA